MQTYPTPWYPVVPASYASPPSGQGQGERPSNPHAQYYMGVQPAPPSAPPPAAYPNPVVSQDARYDGANPGGPPTPGAIASTSHPPIHQSMNLIIHEGAVTMVASATEEPTEHHVAVMTRQQRANNPPLEPISEEDSDSGEEPDIPAVIHIHFQDCIVR